MHFPVRMSIQTQNICRKGRFLGTFWSCDTWLPKKKIYKMELPYSTRDSLVVPYQSTDRAQRCLTSQFGWDAVLSPWYDRMTRPLQRRGTPVVIFFFGSAKNQKHFLFFCFLEALGIVGHFIPVGHIKHQYQM